MSVDDLRVGFLGGGKMATALARGLIQSGFIAPDQITASDISSSARDAFSEATGARATPDNAQTIANADVLVLAVKPHVIESVLDEIQEAGNPDSLIVSIAAGVTLATLELHLSGFRIVRVMPNTPCLVGAGAAGFAKGTAANADDARLVQQLLETVGTAFKVPEQLLDAVTGLSGSGPAYVFEIIEALSDGGVLMGLPRHIATQLAAQTLMGAAKMVLETGDHPGILKDAVTSPGGTTIAGLHELERAGVRGTIMNAVQAAAERARELGHSKS